MSVEAGGRLTSAFRDHVVAEGVFRCAAYILRLPSHGGHWVTIVPPYMDDATTRADTVVLLCDSMYTAPFLLTNDSCEDLLTTCAMDAAHAAVSAFGCEWGCFLMGLRL